MGEEGGFSVRWQNKAIATVLGLSLLLPLARPALADPPQVDIDTLTKVYTLLTNQHYTHPNADTLLQAAIQGMLDSIGDPFTNYLSPDQYQQFTNAINQSYAGIGAMLGENDQHQVVVNEVYPGNPAAKAGLQQGDVLLTVDGAPIANTATGGQRLRGAAGTSVVLGVQRGGKTLTYTITRAAIQLPEVQSHDLGNGIAYLRIYSFGQTAASEFSTALQNAESHGAKGLVLDLRGNGGGYVDAALEIANHLLPKDAIILIAHDDQGQLQRVTADGPGDPIPLVVLVDEHSASASEILAGALQKTGRAHLIGTRTFGKGTMQAPTQLPNGGFVKISIDRWALADGQSPDKVGLMPDLAITNPDLVAHAALEFLSPGRTVLTFNRQQPGGDVDGFVAHSTPVPVLQGSEVYLPLRYTAEALGQPVTWMNTTGTANFTLRGHALAADLAHGTLQVDGKPLPAHSAVQNIDGRGYIAASALQTLVHAVVQVNPDTVVITVPGPTQP